MCGRFAIYSDPDLIRSRFNLSQQPEIFVNYNASPGQNLPVIVQSSAIRQLKYFKWGLLPSWSVNPKTSSPLINARVETITTKPSFSRSFRYRRCLVPANGFYEWSSGPIKSANYFYLKSTPLFALAGLYDSWISPHGSRLDTFTIITTTANPHVSPIHNRMPCILSSADETAWLDPQVDQVDKLVSLLKPYPGSDLIANPVNKQLDITGLI